MFIPVSSFLLRLKNVTLSIFLPVLSSSSHLPHYSGGLTLYHSLFSLGLFMHPTHLLHRRLSSVADDASIGCVIWL